MAIRIITDSTCDLEMDQQKVLNIDILPLTVMFGEESYQDGIDISKKEFFEKMRTHSIAPTTSQVTPEAFETLYRRYTEAGDEIITLVIAEKLSGTLQSATIAKNMVGNEAIVIIDSETTTLGLALLVKEAVKLRDAGASASEIINHIEAIKKNVVAYAIIDNLEFLKKGGRLSTMGATIGTLLSLKPIVKIHDSKVEVVNKVRGLQKANKWMADQVKTEIRQPDNLIVLGHTDASAALEQFKSVACTALNFEQAVQVEIGITVGTHGGPGCVGIGFLNHKQIKS